MGRFIVTSTKANRERHVYRELVGRRFDVYVPFCLLCNARSSDRPQLLLPTLAFVRDDGFDPSTLMTYGARPLSHRQTSATLYVSSDLIDRLKIREINGGVILNDNNELSSLLFPSFRDDVLELLLRPMKAQRRTFCFLTMLQQDCVSECGVAA